MPPSHHLDDAFEGLWGSPSEGRARSKGALSARNAASSRDNHASVRAFVFPDLLNHQPPRPPKHSSWGCRVKLRPPPSPSFVYGEHS